MLIFPKYTGDFSYWKLLNSISVHNRGFAYNALIHYGIKFIHTSFQLKEANKLTYIFIIIYAW